MPGPSAYTAWPFIPWANPVAPLGRGFTYAEAHGYQVGLRFDLRAWGLTAWDASTARLDLLVRVRVIAGQIQGTEGIWVDGVLSGTSWSEFRAPAMSIDDLSEQNVAFTEAVLGCCVERTDSTSLNLDDLLRGSWVTSEAVLADGQLEVVIADDVEVYGATLHVCLSPARAGREAGTCHDVPASPLRAGVHLPRMQRGAR